MPQLTPEGQRMVEEIASRHGVGTDAVLTLLTALAAGGGNQAQFSHPDLGGMGQWSRGGMITVGDMFNSGLKARVDALCTELSDLLARSEPFAAAPVQSQSQSQGGAGAFGQSGSSLFVPGRSSAGWPAGLGTPASGGAQNDLRYAWFPVSRRLAIDVGGRLSVHDTGEHQISGVSQQQGSDQSITFTSQHGLVRVADLPLVRDDQEPPPPAEHGPARHPAPPDRPEAAADSPTPAGRAPAALRRAVADDDVIGTIERLAELRRKDILTEEEFAAKKAELLARL
jgi:hypothetical protein